MFANRFGRCDHCHGPITPYTLAVLIRRLTFGWIWLPFGVLAPAGHPDWHNECVWCYEHRDQS